jgi:hypothetical protein
MVQQSNCSYEKVELTTSNYKPLNLVRIDLLTRIKNFVKADGAIIFTDYIFSGHDFADPPYLCL